MASGLTIDTNAEAAVILVDARKGVLTQTRRHSYIVSLFGIHDVVLAVNRRGLPGFGRACSDGEDFFLFFLHMVIDDPDVLVGEGLDIFLEAMEVVLGNFADEVDGIAVFTDADPVRRARARGFYRAFLRPVDS